MHDTEILNLLQRDLREPFIDSMLDALRGGYAAAYDDIAKPPGGFVVQRPSEEWDPFDLQAVRNGRRGNGMRALMRSCSDHGAPYQVKTLPYNGQKIVVGQLGQLLVVAEPIDNLRARPERAAYKEDLAASHFAMRQLEMDLGDGWRQRIDARNTMLVVIQHGMRVGGFNRRDTSLAMMRLVIPDASFGSWLFQADVMNGELGSVLGWTQIKKVGEARPDQEDRVFVSLKRGLGKRDIGL
jgi:hypothetical protein